MAPTPPPPPTLLTRLLHLTLNSTLPVLRHPLVGALAIPTAAAFAVQGIVGAPSVFLWQSERFYDLSGSVGFLAVAGLSLYLPALRARVAARVAGAGGVGGWPGLLEAFRSGGAAAAGGFGWRQVVVTACVVTWAARCKQDAELVRPSSTTRTRERC